jgi:hypothetical protein
METEKSNNIIVTLNYCASECSKCAIACLGEEDVAMMANCIKLDLDCAEICKTVASFASRSSIHAQHLMKECIEICKACASECEKHSHFEHCKKCAEVCRICIDECTSMQMAA